MATGQSTGAQVGPVLQVQVPAAARDRGRALAAFVTAFAGLVLVAIISTGHWWSILLWLLVGLVAGSIARQGRLVWITWLALVAYYPVATAVGVQGDHGPFWYLGAILGGLLVSAGFAVGSAIGRRADPWREARETWRRLGRVGRRGAAATVVAGIVAFSGYTAYVGLLGSDQIVHPTGKWTGCDTPASRFGWAYEAINYNPADDARLAAENPDSAHCRSQGEVAGNEVVSSDGVPIAGWYVPAASGMDSTGPTVVVVHGWKSNKSEALKYAVPFHDAFNVVLLDLRNGGRSGVADTTWGLREQLDVRAMIDWLERTKHPTWIAAMGNSMGGATILAEAATDVRVRALILDSMHAQSSVTFGNGLEVENGQPSLPGSWAMVAGVSFRIGADVTQVDPIRTIVEVGNRPVLLIHGTADALDRPTTSADLNFHAALAAGVPVQLEYCPGATHGAVIDHCPADWARWATSFLAGARAQT